MTTPRDASTLLRRTDSAPRSVRTYSLRVVQGPDDRTHVVLDGSKRVLVGYSPACSLRLTDRAVSRRHAGFDVVPGGVHVVDFGSTNGTLVNGVRVVEAILGGGEAIQLGYTVLSLEPTGEADALESDGPPCFGRVLGRSIQMRRLYPLLARLAGSDVPILLEGETGTGKELVAEAIHEASARANGPFVVFDCAGVPGGGIEEKLFGRPPSEAGAFQHADGGTLLLDEVHELDLGVQRRVLRAIERAEGFDVRVVATSRRNLDDEVQSGRFGEDLFFRLTSGRVELPPLRHRRDDIELLARHFWDLAEGEGDLPVSVLHRLMAYEWPGNVRELEAAVSSRVALGELTPMLPPGAAEPGAPPNVIDAVLAEGLPLPLARKRVLEEFEQRYVEHVLRRYGGNISRAAAASGIKRRYFHVLKARLNKR